jgi:drug/metabolite transporter (DMT)-like permease
MLRSTADRFLLFLPLPATPSWFYIILSAVIHVGYSLFLVNIYKIGELGQVYPIARGSSPLLVSLGGLVFAHEQLSALTIAGIILVSSGIIALSKNRKDVPLKLALMALATGAVIACYTVVDGIGARQSGSAASYATWMFAIYGAMMVPVYWLRRNKRKIRLSDPHMQKSAIGGVLGLLGYCIIIWAISISPMGPVSALRETSVVFAALIGWFFLKENLTLRRMAACGIIAIGAACLA